MNNPIPVFLAFHVEPNGLYLDLSQKPKWTGFESTFEFIKGLRTEKLINNIKLIWLFRSDPQIDIVYGNAGWGFKEYADQISYLTQRGDDLGLHVHPYRMIDGQNKWIQDFSDEGWVSHCITVGVNSYKENLASQPLSFSIGPNSTSTKVVNHCRQLGLKYDFTVSHNGKRAFNEVPGEIKGKIGWFKNLPDHPYSPAKTDMTIEDKNSQDYFMIPVHYFKFQDGFLNLKGLGKKILRGESDYRNIKPSLSMDHDKFKKTLELTQKRNLKYLLIETRTHVFTRSEQQESARQNLILLNEMHGKSIIIKAPGSGMF